MAQINLANLEIRISLLTLVLMNCSHRSTKIDVDSQLQKLRDFINPVQQLWQNPQMGEAISSFGGFCELLGLGKVSDYLVSRRVHEIQDWGLYQLDAEGQAIQKDLDERVKVDKASPFLHIQLISHPGLAIEDYQIFLWVHDGKDREGYSRIRSNTRFMA